MSGPNDLKDDSEKAALALTLARYELARDRPGAVLAELRKALAKVEPGSGKGTDVGSCFVCCKF